MERVGLYSVWGSQCVDRIRHTGVTRKQLGLAFQGETREEHIVVGEAEVFGLERHVGTRSFSVLLILIDLAS